MPIRIIQDKTQKLPSDFRFVGTSHPKNELGILFSARGSFSNVFTIDTPLESNITDDKLLQHFAFKSEGFWVCTVCNYLETRMYPDKSQKGRKTAVWARSLIFYSQVDGEMDQLYGRNTHDPYAHTIKSWIFPLSSAWTIWYRRCRVRLCFTDLFIGVDVDQSSWQSVHVLLLY